MVLENKSTFKCVLFGNIPDVLNHWHVISLHHNDKESQDLQHTNSLTWIQAGKTSAGPLDLQRYGRILRRIRVLAGERRCSGLIAFRRDFVVNSCVPKNNEYRGAVRFMLPQSSTLNTKCHISQTRKTNTATFLKLPISVWNIKLSNISSLSFMHSWKFCFPFSLNANFLIYVHIVLCTCCESILSNCCYKLTCPFIRLALKECDYASKSNCHKCFKWYICSHDCLENGEIKTEMHSDVYTEVKIIPMILWVITLRIFWVVNNVSDNHSATNFKTNQMSQHQTHFNFTVL